MNRMAKMKRIQRTNGAGMPRTPASVLDNIIDKYTEKGLGGQERSIKPILASTSGSEMSSVSKRYMRTKMFSTSVLVGIPSGVARTSEIPKQEYKLVDSSCDATEERKKSPGGYNRMIERVVEGGKKATDKEELLKQALDCIADRYRKLCL